MAFWYTGYAFHQIPQSYLFILIPDIHLVDYAHVYCKYIAVCFIQL